MVGTGGCGPMLRDQASTTAAAAQLSLECCTVNITQRVRAKITTVTSNKLMLIAFHLQQNCDSI